MDDTLFGGPCKHGRQPAIECSSCHLEVIADLREQLADLDRRLKEIAELTELPSGWTVLERVLFASEIHKLATGEGA